MEREWLSRVKKIEKIKEEELKEFMRDSETKHS
jgi:hypothetical protein